MSVVSSNRRLLAQHEVVALLDTVLSVRNSLKEVALAPFQLKSFLPCHSDWRATLWWTVLVHQLATVADFELACPYVFRQKRVLLGEAFGLNGGLIDFGAPAIQRADLVERICEIVGLDDRQAIHEALAKIAPCVAAGTEGIKFALKRNGKVIHSGSVRTYMHVEQLQVVVTVPGSTRPFDVASFGYDRHALLGTASARSTSLGAGSILSLGSTPSKSRRPSRKATPSRALSMLAVTDAGARSVSPPRRPGPSDAEGSRSLRSRKRPRLAASTSDGSDEAPVPSLGLASDSEEWHGGVGGDTDEDWEGEEDCIATQRAQSEGESGGQGAEGQGNAGSAQNVEPTQTTPVLATPPRTPSKTPRYTPRKQVSTLLAPASSYEELFGDKKCWRCWRGGLRCIRKERAHGSKCATCTSGGCSFHSQPVDLEMLKELEATLVSLQALSKTAAVSTDADIKGHVRVGLEGLIKPLRLHGSLRWLECKTLFIALGGEHEDDEESVSDRDSIVSA